MVVGNNGAIFRYLNGNLTYESSGTNFNLNAIAEFGNTYYVVGDAGTILKNSGSGWMVQNLGITNKLNDVVFVNAQLGYVCGTNGTVLQTTDGGNTWLPSLPPGAEIDFSSVAVQGVDTAWVVGTKGIIYQTEDGGLSWARFSKGVSNNTSKVTFKQPRGYIAGSSGSLRTFQANTVLGTINLIHTPQTFYTLFPNPNAGNFSIRFNTSSAQETNLRVIDVHGNVAYAKVLYTLAEGIQSDLQLDNLGSGIYFLTVQNEGSYFVEKIIISK
jgi:photosystem II stability/assembly factor-like uncharacterized protein